MESEEKNKYYLKRRRGGEKMSAGDWSTIYMDAFIQGMLTMVQMLRPFYKYIAILFLLKLLFYLLEKRRRKELRIKFKR